MGKHSARLLLLGLPALMLSCRESSIHPLKDLPSAHLGAVSYPAGLAGLNQSGDAEIHVTFEEAHASHLADASGGTASPPAGLRITTSGNPSCDVEISSSSLSGATITVSDCTGDGEVRISVAEDTIENENGEGNEASNTVSVRVDNTAPTLVSFSATQTAVDSAAGVNTAALVFSERVTALSADNSGAEFTVSGCANAQPAVATSMSVNGSGQSVATLSLSGGDCEDGDEVALDFDLGTVTDLAGNSGITASDQATYDVTSAAIVNIGSVTYPAPTSAIHQGSAPLALALSLSSVASSALADSIGSSSSPPAGLDITENGASCGTVELVVNSLASASVNVSDCSGDGEIEILVEAAVATSAGGLPNRASAARSVRVQNSLPEVTSLTLTGATTTDLGGANSFDLVFNQDIQDLPNGAITVSGCTNAQPSASIVMGNDGSGHSTATVTLSGGDCLVGDQVEIRVLHPQILNLSGLAGTDPDEVATYDIVP